MPPIKEFPAFTGIINFIVGNWVEVLGNKLRKRIKKKRGVYYNSKIITLNNWLEKYNLKEEKVAFFSDGVHPSKLSYQLWGKDMANFIITTRSFKLWMRKK